MEGSAGSAGGARDGRRNQKLRTRRALVDAAAELLREGRAVTIADVAEAARVSPATAYRYFSSPQELIRETRTLLRTPDVTADLPADPAGRVDTVVSRVADMQLANEPAWRAMLGASLERYVRQSDGQEEPFPTRSRNRLDLSRTALDPLAATLPPAALRRLTMALTLVYGVEALVSTRDVCDLEPEEAKDVMRWAARALLDTALREETEN
ncbi:TetR/AcrR family transcriptional regulator [Streptomyces hyaluromycini]|uniref:TetR/AcrR family transcriptional regulator n=1 Tax=Streptomyces hyaluromycini TaxID=1377993 RepID=UPI000B5C740E|nr:TetR/AcrR family transcriptional regulator [Streptomyces hyaluromycini]